ncbi:Receptor-like protein 12 [Rhynchospora pubera]|uniref:Receptor-like protein 12 n=1 Tax=Rhynchospora pubera TaxID=906938 RepID=A0AAV8EP24_9POAL|nr:Receptor-like protein 12 [Rhynchospora pubera]
MSGVNFQDSKNWAQASNTLPLLQSLYLRDNNLTTIPSSIIRLNFSSLETLSIIDNKFNSKIPNWIGKLTTLTTLELLFCSFVGQIPNQLNNLTSLSTLMLLEDYLEGPMPPLHNLKNLTELIIWGVSIREDIRVVVNRLANDTLDKLEILLLPNASLIGNLIGWMSKMPNLIELDLSYNNLNGPLPIVIGNLTRLEYLDLDKNNFTGEVSEAHLAGLSNLKALFLGSSYLNLTMNMNWVPPFQLDYLYLSSCKLGPYFPLWLQNQSHMSEIDLSNTEIVEIVPHWFWKFRSLSYIDLSYNHIKGTLPLSLEHLTNLHLLFLHNNLFEGGIPCLPQYVEFVDLSDNLFSGNIPHGLPNALIVVNLAHNNLSGVVPSSIGNLYFLWALQLNNNSLIGELPLQLQLCQNLVVLDIGENKFEGQIPKWMGENLRNLTFLRLRSNLFSGTIPIQLIKLQYLQVLDLANNKISGMIPQNMDFFSSMAFLDDYNDNLALIDFLRFNDQYYYNVSVSVTMKGRDLVFTTTLSFLKSIDISGNHLTGMIPKTITSLHGLISLNLSNNHLIGPIPSEIGKMYSLESLDLRNNELSGMIPQSLTNLNFLATLNLSYNNLSGRIPTGNQLQTLDDSYIYVENNYLCGPPTEKSCDSTKVQNSTGHARKVGEELSKILLYLFIIFGFGCGIWVVLWILLFKITWRYMFFHIVDSWLDSIYT